MVFDQMRTTLVRHGEFPFKLFGALILLRTVDLFLIQSSFVPDEYWQSLEVAHKEVFGYGYLTWEWNQGIRSYLYVSLISGLYYILKFFQIDSTLLVIWTPRILQGIISALGDVYFVRWVHEKRYRQHSWAFLTWVTSYFISYCSTRTLINTLEMNLTTIALYYYPWSPKRNNTVFAFLISFLFFIRPTSTVIWLPLILMNILSVPNKFKYIITSYVPISIIVGSACFLLDSHFYGKWIFTPWEFFSFNVLKNISQYYGTHDFLWYFYVGIPVALGIQMLPFYFNTVKIFREYFQKKRFAPKYDTEQQVTVTVLWSLICLSFIPHKEFRFLLPLMPMMLFISSSVWSKWSVHAKLSHIYGVAFLFIVTNFCTLLFLGQFHQAGKLETMRYLSNDIGNSTSGSKLLFLTPCHSLPLYSHLHVDVPVRFITCEPNIKGVEAYTDESDEFFNNSMAWIKREYSSKSACSLPTHIVMYNSLNITNFLYINKYNLSASFFDAYFYPERTGDFIHVYKRKGSVC